MCAKLPLITEVNGKLLDGMSRLDGRQDSMLASDRRPRKLRRIRQTHDIEVGQLMLRIAESQLQTEHSFLSRNQHFSRICRAFITRPIKCHVIF